MAELVTTPEDFLKGALHSRAKVLLVNPPVQEKRYHWLRWNQPQDLLRLSSWIKAEAGAADIRLFDFMLPDEKGDVGRHKIKETWTGPGAPSLWHFGQPFEAFDGYLDELVKVGWVPDLIVISSLTSYWHVAIEKLLLCACNLLGSKYLKATTIALYGAYPSLEREHAERQLAANVAFTRAVDVRAYAPDFGLYIDQWHRLPVYFGLDIEASDAADHLAMCIELQTEWDKARGITKAQTITAAFLNDDIAGPKSKLADVARQADRYKGRVRIDAICGVRPRSAGIKELEMLTQLGAKSIYVEYETKTNGGLDIDSYKPFHEFLEGDRMRRRGGDDTQLAARDAITAFINIGLPWDEIETIVRNTLVLNQYFQAIILKPFGYSPSFDKADATLRRERWPMPAASSPQWFPYVGNGSKLTLEDYDNLMRWQGVLNKRVKSFTFDFLGSGAVPKLVRETLVEESWKQRREGRP